MSKIGPLIFCLIFFVCFGGVGIGASYVAVATIIDGMKAKDWVLVKADVTRYKHPNVTYKYTFDGKEYTGDRMGSAVIGGTDNIDDWHSRMRDYLNAAVNEKKPIQVHVNPDNPSQSMIDTAIRWNFLVFTLPFALGFGGVGLGALYVAYKVIRGKDWEQKKKAAQGERPQPRASNNPGERRTGERIKSDAGAGVVGIWIFTFFWNVIAFPIAIMAVPQLVAQREWVGLFVLLFPGIGLLLLWAAIRGTIYYFRRGGISLMLTGETPRVGGIVQGYVGFGRGVNAGEVFKIRLVCYKNITGNKRSTESATWSKEIESRATDLGGEARLQFRFDVPASCKPSGEVDDNTSYRWKVEARPSDKGVDMNYGFQIALDEALMVDSATAAAEPALPDAPELANIEQMMGGFGVKMDADARAKINAMTPEERQMAMKVANLAKFAPAAKNVFIVIVVLIVASQVIGFIAPLLAMIK